MSLRSGLGSARTAVRERAGRIVHAARHHARRGTGVFNLDFHISVAQDVRTVLEARRIPLTAWTLSSHAWVLGRSRDLVAVVNERTFPDFGPAMAKRFRLVYGAYLGSFRGYLATHTPCMSLLYEGMVRPTLAICSTRYEWPFTFDRERWHWLDERLRAAVADGWLHLVANNRADAGYVENYVGVMPRYVPSACTYVDASYTGRIPRAVVCTKRDKLALAICRELRSDAIPLRAGLGARYSWSELYDHRAIVFIPYNVSTMSLFEHYSAGAPVYVPDRDFLKRLMREHPAEVLSQLSYGQVVGRTPTPANTEALDLNDVRDEQVVDWFLDRADFYDAEWMPRIRRFESWAHLDHLLATDDPLGVSESMAGERPARLAKISALWDELPWLAGVREGMET